MIAAAAAACAAPQQGSGAPQTGPVEITLSYTQGVAPLETMSVIDSLAPRGDPPTVSYATWLDDSTLQVARWDNRDCPAEPVSLSHDGSGTYTVEVARDPATIDIPCTLVEQAFVTTFSNVPRPIATGTVVVLVSYGESLPLPIV